MIKLSEAAYNTSRFTLEVTLSFFSYSCSSFCRNALAFKEPSKREYGIQLINAIYFESIFLLKCFSRQTALIPSAFSKTKCQYVKVNNVIVIYSLKSQDSSTGFWDGRKSCFQKLLSSLLPFGKQFFYHQHSFALPFHLDETALEKNRHQEDKSSKMLRSTQAHWLPKIKTLLKIGSKSVLLKTCCKVHNRSWKPSPKSH